MKLAKAKLWFVILVAPWVVSLGIRGFLLATGEVRYSRIVVRGASSPDSYPVFLAMRAGNGALEPGDELVSIGDIDLRGASSLAFMGHAMDAAREDPVVEVRYARDREIQMTSVDLSADYGVLARRLVIGLAFGLTGIAVFLRAPRDPRAIPLLGAFALYGATVLAWGQGGGAELTFLTGFLSSAGELFGVFGVAMLLIWPRQPLTRAEKVLPLFFVPFAFIEFATWHPGWLGLQGARELYSVAGVLRCVAALGLVVRAYRLCDARGRRQLRWGALGIGVAALVLMTANLATALDPAFRALREWSQLAMIAAPAGFLVAIVRDDLFDVDRLISATVSYSLLGIVLLATLLVFVPRLAEATGAQLGFSADASQLMVSLCAAVLIVPSGRLLRPRVEALLFRERDALRQGVGDLLAEIAVAGSAREIAERTGERLDALLRPEALTIYLLDAAVFQPVVIRSRLPVPAALPAQGPLFERLEASAQPLDVEGWRRHGSLTGLGHAAESVLSGISVVIPVLVQGGLAAFLALGAKRSGDIYTQTDRALLTLVSQAAANRIAQLDQETVLDEVRSMRDSLRRYVPGAVADRLAAGGELVTGNQEVSVLFVDIRGYTALSEANEAAAIFSLVNRYTEAVSAVVRSHGGSVVEFNGDGMMAVFGAPHPDPHKERSAVSSALEILDAVERLEPAGQGNGDPVRVGVGVASGEAYVGNVQAVDRMIWTAIGNTTNLAARLQALTRELNAAVVIDTWTWNRAQDVAKEFELRPNLQIRGRTGSHDFYVLPLYR